MSALALNSSITKGGSGQPSPILSSFDPNHSAERRVVHPVTVFPCFQEDQVPGLFKIEAYEATTLALTLSPTSSIPTQENIRLPHAFTDTTMRALLLPVENIKHQRNGHGRRGSSPYQALALAYLKVAKESQVALRSASQLLYDFDLTATAAKKGAALAVKREECGRALLGDTIRVLQSLTEVMVHPLASESLRQATAKLDKDIKRYLRSASLSKSPDETSSFVGRSPLKPSPLPSSAPELVSDPEILSECESLEFDEEGNFLLFGLLVLSKEASSGW